MKIVSQMQDVHEMEKRMMNLCYLLRLVNCLLFITNCKHRADQPLGSRASLRTRQKRQLPNPAGNKEQQKKETW